MTHTIIHGFYPWLVLFKPFGLFSKPRLTSRYEAFLPYNPMQYLLCGYYLILYTMFNFQCSMKNIQRLDIAIFNSHCSKTFNIQVHFVVCIFPWTLNVVCWADYYIEHWKLNILRQAQDKYLYWTFIQKKIFFFKSYFHGLFCFSIHLKYPKRITILI